MLEYVLFHNKPFDLFVAYLTDHGIKPETSEINGVYEIRIPEETDGALSDEIEDYYDELMEMNRQLYFSENPQPEDNFSVATVLIELENGDTTSAHVRPDLLYRVIEAVGNDGLDELIKAITVSVENPDERSYCQKVRDGEVEFNDA